MQAEESVCCLVLGPQGSHWPFKEIAQYRALHHSATSLWYQVQPLYLLPPQSPNTDTGLPVLAPHKSECKAVSN